MTRTARAALVLLLSALASFAATGTASAMTFNPHADLDTSTITDLRTPAHVPSIHSAPVTGNIDARVAAGQCIILPNFYNGETTPTVQFGECWIPEESPSGGYAESWADNSVIYDDGWILWVNDSTGDVTWIDGAEYGAGAGAVCGTDAQCEAWEQDHPTV